MLAGSDVFTYWRQNKSQTVDDLDTEIMQNKQLMESVQQMRLKLNKKTISGRQTRSNSYEKEALDKWSFFEKIERLK